MGTPALLGMVAAIWVPAAVAADLSPEVATKPSQQVATELEYKGASEPEPWRSRERLLGDLGGLRPWLARLGVEIELVSVDEGFSHSAGSEPEGDASTYHGLTDLVVTLDTEAAGWWRGGRLSIDLQNLRGGDISDWVGDLQGVSNIVGPPGTRLVEYYLEQEVGGGALRVKVGKQDANADFVATDGGGEFVNSSFGVVPTVPIPTFPAPALGLMAAWDLDPRLRLKVGLWDGASEVGSGCLETAFDGIGGTIAATELEARLATDSLLSGAYRVGVWRHSEVALSGAKDSDETPATSAMGVYLAVDQGIWEGKRRRLDLFAQGGWADAQHSTVNRYYGGGVVLRRPFSSVEGETLGLAVAHAELGELEGSVEAGASETVLEAFYARPLSGWLTLKPDLQLIRRPGGSGQNTLVLGVRVETVF